MAPNFSLTKPTQAVPLKQCLKKAQAAYSDTRISFEVKVWVRGDCLKNLLNDQDPHLVQLPNAHGCNLTVTPGWKVKYSGIRWQRIDITGSAVDPERTKRAVFAMLNTVHEAKDHKVGKHLGCVIWPPIPSIMTIGSTGSNMTEDDRHKRETSQHDVKGGERKVKPAADSLSKEKGPEGFDHAMTPSSILHQKALDRFGFKEWIAAKIDAPRKAPNSIILTRNVVTNPATEEDIDDLLDLFSVPVSDPTSAGTVGLCSQMTEHLLDEGEIPDFLCNWTCIKAATEQTPVELKQIRLEKILEEECKMPQYIDEVSDFLGRAEMLRQDCRMEVENEHGSHSINSALDFENIFRDDVEPMTDAPAHRSELTHNMTKNTDLQNNNDDKTLSCSIDCSVQETLLVKDRQIKRLISRIDELRNEYHAALCVRDTKILIQSKELEESKLREMQKEQELKTVRLENKALKGALMARD